jgi:hypothetical protein
MEGKYTYTKRGSRTAGIKAAAAVGCCTVMLGANLPGDIKLLVTVRCSQWLSESTKQR